MLVFPAKPVGDGLDFCVQSQSEGCFCLQPQDLYICQLYRGVLRHGTIWRLVIMTITEKCFRKPVGGNTCIAWQQVFSLTQQSVALIVPIHHETAQGLFGGFLFNQERDEFEAVIGCRKSVAAHEGNPGRKQLSGLIFWYLVSSIYE